MHVFKICFSRRLAPEEGIAIGERPALSSPKGHAREARRLAEYIYKNASCAYVDALRTRLEDLQEETNQKAGSISR